MKCLTEKKAASAKGQRSNEPANGVRAASAIRPMAEKGGRS